MTGENAEATLPQTEFDPRAARPLHDSMLEAPIITALLVLNYVEAHEKCAAAALKPRSSPSANDHPDR